MDVIGHEFTRQNLTGDILEKGMFADLLKGLPEQLDDLKARASNEGDAATRTRLDQQVRVQTAFANSLKDLRVTPPNVTLDDRMTLYRGDREIRLLYLGHGHTGGDLVVYLPKKRLLGSALHDQKVSAADAAKRIDMSAHKAHYQTINGPGVNLSAVSRMFDVMEHQADE